MIVTTSPLTHTPDAPPEKEFPTSKLQKLGKTVTKLAIALYQFKVELEKRFTGELGNWFTYQLPLTATPSEVEDQVEYYKQLLDEQRRPRKRKVAGKPPFEFHSKNKNDHAFDC